MVGRGRKQPGNKKMRDLCNNQRKSSINKVIIESQRATGCENVRMFLEDSAIGWMQSAIYEL